jgi:molybdate transport system regulatory protein
LVPTAPKTPKAPARKRTGPKTQVRGRLWLSRGDQSLAGRGRIDLLVQIDECGSISQAAKQMGMGYKSAWDAVDAMNNAAGTLLVERAVGGRGGGGATLTAQGRKLIEAFRLFEQEHNRFLDRLSAAADDIGPYVNLLGRFAMRTSARNQFFGKIGAVRRGAVNDEVELVLPGGDCITATITCESTANLGLKTGVEAFALIKASWIILMPGDHSARTSARNAFTGTIEHIVKGAVNSEIDLKLPGGAALVAVITNNSVDNLQLREGQQATALFKASHVILGVPA